MCKISDAQQLAPRLGAAGYPVIDGGGS